MVRTTTASDDRDADSSSGADGFTDTTRGRVLRPPEPTTRWKDETMAKSLDDAPASDDQEPVTTAWLASDGGRSTRGTEEERLVVRRWRRPW